jgi:hypothetical protein
VRVIFELLFLFWANYLWGHSITSGAEWWSGLRFGEAQLGGARFRARFGGMVEVVMPAGAAHAGAQGAEPPAPWAATNYQGAQAPAGDAWACGGAAAGAICTHASDGARLGQKRSAAWAELSKLQEARVSSNADWVFARKPGSDGLEGSPGGGADKRRKPAKRWGISLSVPAETPPVEVSSGSSGASGSPLARGRPQAKLLVPHHATLERARAQTCIAVCRLVLRMPLHCSAPGRR